MWMFTQGRRVPLFQSVWYNRTRRRHIYQISMTLFSQGSFPDPPLQTPDDIVGRVWSVVFEITERPECQKGRAAAVTYVLLFFCRVRDRTGTRGHYWLKRILPSILQNNRNLSIRAHCRPGWRSPPGRVVRPALEFHRKATKRRIKGLPTIGQPSLRDEVPTSLVSERMAVLHVCISFFSVSYPSLPA
jgi:hypothetical protein